MTAFPSGGLGQSEKSPEQRKKEREAAEKSAEKKPPRKKYAERLKEIREEP